MREIKFRVWDKDNQKMWDRIDLNFCMKYGQIYIDNDYIKELGISKNVELMQYTGSKDKNGKEIYEGDIVKAEVAGPYTSDVKIKMKGEIIYYEPFACFEVKTKECGQPTMSIFDNFEIIGNKYENPELLGDTNECS